MSWLDQPRRSGAAAAPDRDLAHALGAAEGVRVVVMVLMMSGDVVPHLGEVSGGDGLQTQLLHGPHLDEELVHEDPEEDEEDARDDGEEAEDGVGLGAGILVGRGQDGEVEGNVEPRAEAA